MANRRRPPQNSSQNQQKNSTSQQSKVAQNGTPGVLQSFFNQQANRQSRPEQQDNVTPFPDSDSTTNQTVGSDYQQDGSDFSMPKRDPIGVEQIRKAYETLKKYKQGKQKLEDKIVKNEKWWKMRHWDLERDPSTYNDPKPASGWLFNMIESKHADFMDSFPAADILPREQGDREEATMLSSIIPVIHEQNDFEQVYNDETLYKLKHGTGVYGVFWDQSKLNGLGDISVKSEDILSLFWEPGVTDIQNSRNFFSVALIDNEVLEESYPDKIVPGSLKRSSDSVLKKYMYDDNIDTTDKSLVVDWYYKKPKNGKVTVQFCKFVNDTILYATENDTDVPTEAKAMPVLDDMGNPVIDPQTGQPAVDIQQIPTGEAPCDRGLYDHGMYPFIFDVLFQETGLPYGFGYVDVCKNAQMSIDLLNNAFEKNSLFVCNPRYFVRDDGSINEEEFNDPNKVLIHVSGNLGNDTIAPVQTNLINSNYIGILQNKIDEMKDTSGNRDVSSGGATAGVTAASAIAALQETAGKSSRDIIKTSYRAFQKVVNMEIELIRQFYDLPREFRITGQQGEEEFVTYSNRRIQAQSQGNDFGVDMGYRLPVFDISVKAEKENAYSRMSQNEMALQFYGNGFFNPQYADQALACLDMMDFQGKDSVMQKISQNGTMYQQMIQMQAEKLQMAQVIDAQNGTNMADQVAGDVMQQAGQQTSLGDIDTSMPKQGTVQDNSSIVRNSREQAAETTKPR